MALHRCRRHCLNFKAPRKHEIGVAVCRNCNIFIFFGGRFCPCCKSQLSRRAKASKDRRKVEIRKGFKRF